MRLGIASVFSLLLLAGRPLLGEIALPSGSGAASGSAECRIDHPETDPAADSLIADRVAGEMALEPPTSAALPVPLAGRSAPLAEIDRYRLDARALLTAPFHWNLRQWAGFVAVGAGVVLLTTQDAAIDRAVQRNRSAGTERFSKLVTPLGAEGAAGVSALLLAGGFAFHDDGLRDTGRDAIEAQLFASGVVTPLLKLAFGKPRPRESGDPDMEPFSGHSSFPSGHTTEAFAVASVIAARSRGWVVPAIAYTVASAVGFARIHDRSHYLSDVAAGAAIGTLVGHAVVALHAPPDDGSPRRLHLDPAFVSAAGGAGLGLRLSF